MEFHFSHELRDEFFYVEHLLKNLPLFKTYEYKVIWPGALEQAIAAGETTFEEADIKKAIAEHKLPGASLQAVESGWRAVEEAIDRDFLSKLDVPMPKFAFVHATMFGPGGSHNGAPMLPVLTVGYPQMKGLNFNTVLIHELIEIFIYKRFKSELARNPNVHPLKEAVVDQFCSCDQLTRILGPYRKQTGFSNLPNDWETWLPTKRPGSLTWS